MKYLFLILLIFSCSAPYHIKRAIKKDPNIITEKVDTIKFTFNKVDTIERISNDTIIKEIIVRKIDTMFLTKYKFIDGEDIKTRQEVRQDAKTERTKIRQDSKSERNEVRQNVKKEIRSFGSSWGIWIVCFIILLISLYMIRNDRR